MGLTIHYSLKARGSEAQARKLVTALHQAAQDLPFKELGPVVELSGDQCNPDGHPQEDPLRWLLIQAAQSVEYKPPGRSANQGYRSWFDVPPRRLIAFHAWPGDGCEGSNFGLCQYPAVLETHRGPIKTGLTGMTWASFCKTQYASNPKCGGVPHFLQCHLTVVAMLDKAKELGFLDRVSDEGGFWEKRDVPALVQEIGSWNEMIAALGGKLKDLLGDGPLGLQSAIEKYPNFERLEAAGEGKLPSGYEKLAQLIGRVGGQMPAAGQASAPAPAAS